MASHRTRTDRRGIGNHNGIAGFSDDDIILLSQQQAAPEPSLLLDHHNQYNEHQHHGRSSPPPPYYSAGFQQAQQQQQQQQQEYHPGVSDSSQSPPSATAKMSRDYDDRPWYSRRRTWGIAALLAIIVIVVPVAVTVSKNNAKKNKYPDYVKVNYTLAETYAGETFFDKFNYYTGYDPANGHVHYVPQEMATQYNLTYTTPQTAVLKVDTTVGPGSNPDASTGRFSVRVESKEQYSVGTLFLFSVLHTPYGCGTWPALWLSDPDPNVWPANGEIDVFESTNLGNTGNSASLHTTSGCDMSDVRRDMTGSAGQGDCNNATNSNTGCGVTGSVSTYGEKFNAAGGGVMAVELREEGIRIWQFGREDLPTDIQSNSTTPDPSGWGTAFADFPDTDCDINKHFKNQTIIANIDLCGDLTEAVWEDSGCEFPFLDANDGPSTCVKYVSDNPDAFVDAYWEFESFKVFKAA